MMAAYTRCADMNQPERQAWGFIENCRVKYHPADWIVGRVSFIEALRTALAKDIRRPVTIWETSRSTSKVPDSAAAQRTVIAWHHPQRTGWRGPCTAQPC